MGRKIWASAWVLVGIALSCGSDETEQQSSSSANDAGNNAGNNPADASSGNGNGGSGQQGSQEDGGMVPAVGGQATQGSDAGDPNSVVQTVGAEGQSIAGPAGSELQVPADALTEDVEISLEVAAAEAPAIPPALEATGDVFAFLPHGQSFAVPVTVSVPFTGAAAGQRLFTAQPQGAWLEVPGAQVVGNQLQAEVDHFSFFVGGTGSVSAWETVFSDDFARADGDVGTEYFAQVYPTTGSIQIQAETLEFAAPSETVYSKLRYETAVDQQSVRVSAVFSASGANSDYAISAKDSITQATEVMYVAGLYMEAGTLDIGKWTGDAQSGQVSEMLTVASQNFSAALDTAYALTFTVEGDVLTFTVTNLDSNESTSITGTDPSPLAPGKVQVVGTHYSGSTLTMDDLVVEGY